MFHQVLDLKVKNCPRCLRLLCDGSFNLNASKPDGHAVYCKTCNYKMGKARKKAQANTALLESAGVDKSIDGMP